ncbi:MAG: type II toxin-antitoxin system HicA family toxin [Patescibacteria group bacterium]
MLKLPVLTSKQIIKVLKKKGFELDHITGSHYIFYHSLYKRRVVIPYHFKDLPKGTLLSILKQAGLDREDVI